MLRNAFQIRTKGDYDAFVEFKCDEVELMFQEMILFIDEIGEILKNNFAQNTSRRSILRLFYFSFPIFR